MHQDNRARGENARRSLEHGLRALSAGSFLFQSRVAEELGLHSTDLQAIHALSLAGRPLTAGELGQRLRLTSGSTTTAIDRLVRLGYASREIDATDRRRAAVVLRVSQLKKLRAKYRQIDRRVEKILARRTLRDVECIAQFLSELVTPE